MIANLLQECRSSVQGDLNRYESMMLQFNEGTEGVSQKYRELCQAETNRLRALLDSIDALAGHTEDSLAMVAPQATPTPAPVGEWISVDARRPVMADENDDVGVWTWDGKTVQEDEYGGIFEQPAGPVAGGWVRVGDGFAGDGVGREATHWMARPKPLPPGAQPVAPSPATPGLMPLSDEVTERIAYQTDSADDLMAMADLVSQVAKAKTYGGALSAITTYRTATRRSAIKRTIEALGIHSHPDNATPGAVPSADGKGGEVSRG